jgi:cardiolipin synthase A/B
MFRNEINTDTFKLFDDTHEIFKAMLDDIQHAGRYIYIETYKFGNDAVARNFRDVLTEKAKEGVKVKLLIDSWGTAVGMSFFSELIKSGGEVCFFEKLVFTFDFFTRNHRRDHRKLLLIDDRISYLGSTNFTEYSLNWRELVLRLQSEITIPLKKIFLQNRRLFDKYIYDKIFYTKLMRYKDFEIIRDIPTIAIQKIMNKYVRLIKKAKKEILIETPYFLPGKKFRKALTDAAERGVSVKVIVPKNSDVRVIDLLRNRYLGFLNEKKVEILFYAPGNLHAKTLMIDKEYFSIGSANIDYRSFRYMHEICLIGRDKSIINQLDSHFSETIRYCIPFDRNHWINRPIAEKFFEWILLPFRHYL